MLNDELYNFIKKRKHLIWYVKDYRALDEASIVEHVLNYGDWDDFQELSRIMGVERISQIFRTYAFRPRTNYFPEVRHYFNLYFDKHALTA